jgi:hypothetical protein
MVVGSQEGDGWRRDDGITEPQIIITQNTAKIPEKYRTNRDYRRLCNPRYCPGGEGLALKLFFISGAKRAARNQVDCGSRNFSFCVSLDLLLLLPSPFLSPSPLNISFISPQIFSASSLKIASSLPRGATDSKTPHHIPNRYPIFLASRLAAVEKKNSIYCPPPTIRLSSPPLLSPPCQPSPLLPPPQPCRPRRTRAPSRCSTS